MNKDRLLEFILSMDRRELIEYTTAECERMGVPFVLEDLDDTSIQGLYNFIADYIHIDLQSELHADCRLEVGCPMFPNAETEEDLEEEMEHIIS